MRRLVLCYARYRSDVFGAEAEVFARQFLDIAEQRRPLGGLMKIKTWPVMNVQT